MAPTRWLPLLLAWTLLIQSLAPALASPRPLCAKTPTQSTTHVPSANHAHHQYLVDTSQPYAEVIQEAEWVNNALPLITRYDIGLDRLRMFKYQVTSNGPPPVYSPVLSGWYLFDGLGSTRAVVDDGGVGQSEFGYGDAFGIPYQVAANGTRASAGAGFFLNGQQWDGSGVWNSGEGLYFNRARYYQPGLGRFIGEDPYYGKDYEPSTLHRYLYTSGDSVNFIDPTGEENIASILTSSAIIGILSSSIAVQGLGGAKITSKDRIDGAVFGLEAGLAVGVGIVDGKWPEIVVSGLVGGFFSWGVNCISVIVRDSNAKLGYGELTYLKQYLSFIGGFASSATSTAITGKISSSRKDAAYQKALASFATTAVNDFYKFLIKDISHSAGVTSSLVWEQIKFTTIDSLISAFGTLIKFGLRDEYPFYNKFDDEMKNRVRQMFLDGLNKGVQAIFKQIYKNYFNEIGGSITF